MKSTVEVCWLKGPPSLMRCAPSGEIQEISSAISVSAVRVTCGSDGLAPNYSVVIPPVTVSRAITRPSGIVMYGSASRRSSDSLSAR